MQFSHPQWTPRVRPSVLETGVALTLAVVILALQSMWYGLWLMVGAWLLNDLGTGIPAIGFWRATVAGAVISVLLLPFRRL